MKIGPQTLTIFWRRSASKIEEQKPKNIEASNMEILQITAQAQCFSMFTFSNILHRCCEVASKIHPKLIRKSIEKSTKIVPKLIEKLGDEPVCQKSSKIDQNVTKMEAKIEPKSIQSR